MRNAAPRGQVDPLVRLLPLIWPVDFLIIFSEARYVSFHNPVGLEQEVLSLYFRHDEHEQPYICHQDVEENDGCL